MIEHGEGESDAVSLELFDPIRNDQPRLFFERRGARKKGSRVAIESHAEKNQIEAREFRRFEGEEMTDQLNSQLAGLSLDQTIHLRWTLRDIKSKRTKFSPVSPDDLRTLIEMGLIEMRDETPVLTNKGDSALD